MITSSTHTTPAIQGTASGWIQRWSHLVAPTGTVLDIACGHGRHTAWFAQRGHAVTSIDCSEEAVQAVSSWGEAVLADIEHGPWPLMRDDQARQFDAVIVTNYLWRPLFGRITESLAPGGILLYETFTVGNETVGKPSRPDFLLQPGELLRAFADLRIIAFEEGFLADPARFVQRIVAARPTGNSPAESKRPRYRL